MARLRSRTAITLHWSIALLFFSVAGLGAWMVELNYYHPYYYGSLKWHRILGVVIFILATLKLLLKFAALFAPAAPSPLKIWEQIAARIAHSGLWLALFVLPISGYLISTSAGDAIPLIADFTLPALFSISGSTREQAILIHYWLGYGAVVLAFIHALAALKHHFIDKNTILRQMWW